MVFMSLLNSKSTTDEEMTYSTAHQEEQKLLEIQEISEDGPQEDDQEGTDGRDGQRQ